MLPWLAILDFSRGKKCIKVRKLEMESARQRTPVSEDSAHESMSNT